ncbi:MAG: Type 1 glutamine amidotransferase-like domain-containing protein, partial [Clostridia bacterium]|nr:Type 1 glutamine amidotransferase-like domain-containing protein [Clostridia bacterium]
GAICFFDNMYTDSPSLSSDDKYRFHKGLGLLSGTVCPHFDIRKDDFFAAMGENGVSDALAIEGDCAVVYEDGKMTGSISSGGKSYIIRNNIGGFECYEIPAVKGV